MVTIQATAGTVAGAISSILTTPLDTIKTKLQVMDNYGVGKPCVIKTAKILLGEEVEFFLQGRDMSIENLHQVFTHVFESTFESVEGIAEYVSHPTHVEFANEFLPTLEKFIVVDYERTPVKLSNE